MLDIAPIGRPGAAVQMAPVTRFIFIWKFTGNKFTSPAAVCVTAEIPHENFIEHRVLQMLLDTPPILLRIVKMKVVWKPYSCDRIELSHFEHVSSARLVQRPP